MVKLGAAIFLQPATLECQLFDLITDYSRARKMPRPNKYQPQWDVGQTIRYSVDEIQSGNAVAEHGFKLQQEPRDRHRI
ncbi:hypothetical protein C8R45DRAFT_1028697, partial [Mycena sanguinolenta]